MPNQKCLGKNLLQAIEAIGIKSKTSIPEELKKYLDGREEKAQEHSDKLSGSMKPANEGGAWSRIKNNDEPTAITTSTYPP